MFATQKSKNSVNFATTLYYLFFAEPKRDASPNAYFRLVVENTDSICITVVSVST